MKICIAGGGTGGHLYTGIALAESWTSDRAKQLQSTDFHFIGGTYGLESTILPRYAFPFTLISVAPIKGRRLVDQLKALWALMGAYWKARQILRRERPQLVVGIGGYVSVPVVVAAWRLGIPRVLIDQNAVPGRANRLLGRLVNKVFVHFKEAMTFFPTEKVIQSGNPVRPSFRSSMTETVPPPDLATVKTWRDGDRENRLILLILGGSQGARAVNRALVEWTKALPAESPWRTRLAIVHQTGQADYREVGNHYKELDWQAPILVQPFLDPVIAYYMTADLVVARSGAGTICELAACGKPSLLIPYPYAADNHQEKNARSMESVGGANVILEGNELTDRFKDRLDALLVNREHLVEMGKKARALDFPNAQHVIWKESRVS